MSQYNSPPSIGQFPAAAPSNSGGFVKHLFWIIPTLCVFMMFCCCCGGVGVLGWYGYGIVTSSEPYTLSLQTAKDDPTVQEWLGTPIEAEFFTRADVRPDESAVIQLPLTGPNGSAVLYVDAYHDGTEWIYTRVDVVHSETGETRSLLPSLPGN